MSYPKEVVVHRWPVKERDKVSLSARVVRTAEPTETLVRPFEGAFERGRIGIHFGMAGMYWFSLPDGLNGRCVDAGCLDWVLDAASLKELRAWRRRVVAEAKKPNA